MLLEHIRGISESGCISIFWRIVDLMHEKLSFLVSFQDRKSIFQTIPTHTKEVNPRLNVLLIVLKCLLNHPRTCKLNSNVIAIMKKHSTLKVLTSCTINFVSKCYGKRTSDVRLFEKAVSSSHTSTGRLNIRYINCLPFS